MINKVFVITFLLLSAALLTYDVSILATPNKVAAQAPAVKKPVGLLPIIRLVKDGRTYCSGVVIDKTTIVTASHCVSVASMFGTTVNKDPIDIRAYDNLNRGTTARVMGVLVQLDRAVLKGDFRLFAPANYVSDVEKNVSYRSKGQQYISCGYPLGGKLYCTPLTFIQNAGFMMGVKGILIPGMSGGPTMLQDGTVIAINIAVDQDMSYVSPIYNIDDEKE